MAAVSSVRQARAGPTLTQAEYYEVYAKDDVGAEATVSAVRGYMKPKGASVGNDGLEEHGSAISGTWLVPAMWAATTPSHWRLCSVPSPSLPCGACSSAAAVSAPKNR